MPEPSDFCEWLLTEGPQRPDSVGWLARAARAAQVTAGSVDAWAAEWAAAGGVLAEHRAAVVDFAKRLHRAEVGGGEQ
jgi:predicted oxidoreductase